MDLEMLQMAAHLLAAAQRIVCLTGAGVSAESGIPTFRDAQTGLWARCDPMQLASQEGFAAAPGLVWRWYMERLRTVEHAAPNSGHVALAQLEQQACNFTLVTQNVDDLHERAGSRAVMHLHGRIDHFRCNLCTFEHTLTPSERTAPLPPPCIACGGPVRPGVVWFGEALPVRVLDHAWRAAERCDVMLVVGTSGVVYPAAQLPLLAHHAGARIIVVNLECSPLTDMADVCLQGPAGETLPALVAAL
ncbi:MAG: NAD-dependent deacylase [Caldilineaceae bacterium]|nr:NAD-dependent deacylase [Caldilineaceae bacterium]MBP8291578.1 NAD-dependent deacylase [Caldilineaceae bacterium]